MPRIYQPINKCEMKNINIQIFGTFLLALLINLSLYSQQPIRCADIANSNINWQQLSVDSIFIKPGSGTLTLSDGSGGSIAWNNSDFGGNWLESGCCKICFDYNVDYNPNVPLTPPGNIVKMYIYTGSPFTTLDEFNNQRTKAIYITPSEGLIQDNEWRNYCRPIGLSSGGQLPSDGTGGYWAISENGLVLTGTQACIAWDNLIQNVTGIVLATDYNHQPSEIVSFKNFCWYPCDTIQPSTPCCNVENVHVNFVANYTTSVKNRFALQINAGPVPVQEVEVSMLDYHITYLSQDCKPVNMGTFGTFTVQPNQAGNTNFGALNLSGNNSHSLTWLPGTPSVLNQGVHLLISRPSIHNLTCCNGQMFFCIRVRIKDVNCNVCEKIICRSLNLNDNYVDQPNVPGYSTADLSALLRIDKNIDSPGDYGINDEGIKSAIKDSDRIPEALITLEIWNEKENGYIAQKVKKTDHLGTYHFKNLSKGKYRLTVNLPGTTEEWQKKEKQMEPQILYVNCQIESYTASPITFASKLRKDKLLFVSPEFELNKEVDSLLVSVYTSVNNYGINDEGIKKLVDGNPVNGGEIYIELEPDDDPTSIHVITDENGEFEFIKEISPVSATKRVLKFTIIPPKSFKIKYKLPADYRETIRVPLKVNSNGKYRYILKWIPGTDNKIQTKGAFAISGKSET
jgi:hypothetical protein